MITVACLDEIGEIAPSAGEGLGKSVGDIRVPVADSSQVRLARPP